MRTSTLIALFALLFTAATLSADWDAGQAALANRDYRTAAVEFQKVVDQHPNAFSGHYMLGLSLAYLGSFAESERSLKHAERLVERTEDRQQLWQWLGYVYEGLRRYDESIGYYTWAGDSAAVARVKEHQVAAAREHAKIAAENRQIEKMQREAREFEKQLKELEGGGGA